MDQSAIVFRLAAHIRLRNAVCYLALGDMQHDPVSKAKSAARRALGHGHARVGRGVADRARAVDCTMLASQTLFDPAFQEIRVAVSNANETPSEFAGWHRDQPNCTS